MTVIEFDFLQGISGKDVDEHKQLMRDTYYITEEYGGLPNATAYFKYTNDPNSFFRIAGWPGLHDFVAAFHECLSDGSLDEWSDHILNNRATGFDVEYCSLPLDAPLISITLYHLSDNDTKEFGEYIETLKNQIGGAVVGAPASGWNNEAHSELILVCGWKSADQYEDALKNDRVDQVKAKFKDVERVEEFLVRRIDLGEGFMDA